MDKAVKVLGRWRMSFWPLLHGPSGVVDQNICQRLLYCVGLAGDSNVVHRCLGSLSRWIIKFSGVGAWGAGPLF